MENKSILPDEIISEIISFTPDINKFQLLLTSKKILNLTKENMSSYSMKLIKQNDLKFYDTNDNKKETFKKYNNYMQLKYIIHNIPNDVINAISLELLLDCDIKNYKAKHGDTGYMDNFDPNEFKASTIGKESLNRPYIFIKTEVKDKDKETINFSYIFNVILKLCSKPIKDLMSNFALPPSTNKDNHYVLLFRRYTPKNDQELKNNDRWVIKNTMLSPNLLTLRYDGDPIEKSLDFMQLKELFHSYSYNKYDCNKNESLKVEEESENKLSNKFKILM